MRNVLLRTFVLAIVVAMGLLAIAHAQRTVPDPVAGQAAQGDAPSNPLRGGSAADNGANNAVAPAPPDTIPPSDNPLRTLPAVPQHIAQDNPLRSGQPEPLRPDPFHRRPTVNNDRDVRTVADNEPAGPALAPQTQFNPPPLNSAGPGLGGGEPRLLTPNEAPMGPAVNIDNRPPATRVMSSGAPTDTIPPADNIPSAGDTRPLRPEPNVFRTGTAMSDTPSNGPTISGPTNDDSATAAVSAATSGGEGAGQPGERSLEGPQTPQLMLQKIAPPEVQVGRPAVLRTVVRNTGTATASDVEIHDMIPKGVRLLGTAPHAQQGPRGELTWSIGTIKPGEESTVEMQITPVEEGDIGSVATVQFHAAASARSRCTRPRLVVTTTGTPQVLMGDQAALTFTVSNPGTGMATGVVLHETIPAGAQHPAGGGLDCIVGDLRPGETRKMELRLKAVQAGTIVNMVSAHADAGLKAEHRFAVQVVSPQLEVAMNGPKRRYLEREATYQLAVSNPGTASAKQIQLVAYLPPGLKFVNASNLGHYDEASRAVSWQLDELPINAHDSVQLVTMPVEAGQQSIKLRGTAQRGLAVEKEHPVVVEGLASVSFQMTHTRDPIEINGETSYEVSVVNQGSKASTNVRLVLNLPPQLKPLAAEGPARYTISDNQVVFESMPQLPAKSVVSYRVKAKGIQAGDLRVRCQLMTDEMQAPVSKEDNTRVYGDE